MPTNPLPATQPAQQTTPASASGFTFNLADDTLGSLGRSIFCGFDKACRNASNQQPLQFGDTNIAFGSNSGNSFMIIVVAIVVLVGLAFGLIFYFNKKSPTAQT